MIVIFLGVVFTERYIRGLMLIIICTCLWINVKIEPATEAFMISRSGFLSKISNKSLAVVFSITTVLFWVVILQG